MSSVVILMLMNAIGDSMSMLRGAVGVIISIAVAVAVVAVQSIVRG